MAYGILEQRMEFKNVTAISLSEWTKLVEGRFLRAVIKCVSGSAATKDRVWSATHPKANNEFGRFSEEDGDGWVRVRVI